MAGEELIGKLAETIINGDKKAACEVSQEILAAEIDPLEAILKGAKKGLDIIGDRFQRLEAFLPELILAGEAMKTCTEILVPHINPTQIGSISLSKVVIGTVSGDLHDIGKNIVANMLTVSGFEVIDLGINVPVKRFIEKAEETQAKVIALSALLTQTAYYQREVINYLKDAGMRNKYYVVVGGSPISPEWANEIGADGYGRTAVDASQVLKRLVTEGVPPPLPQTIVVQ